MIDPSGDCDRRESGPDAGDGHPAGSDVAVRPAGRADLLDVLRIERESFAEPWPYAAFESLVDAPAFLVAVTGTDDNRPILGYVVGDVTPNHGRDIGHIKDLAVRTDARGAGIGRRLLREALVELSLSGAVVAKLEVREGNDAARSLYRAEGFEPTRRVPRYYGDGEDALLLVTDL
ncbi:ribosomal-protein-alanine N-acetyltransferase [Halobellus salinus]|uniref:Ribosomal-protein-alanine N-acetyltransferase n=1 Tax=Halobellus salinus TaxID=931585 RepID=A0A830EIT1_9EURY|nr:ribosomal-protein-alanine N-acetyltransferase [Halobellus salinus]SMP33043.1 [SSU ribosomal protein S18P]-alanine acetyltransferase [Halobellus salinus]